MTIAIQLMTISIMSSMVVNGNWRVVRYDKANINLEKEASLSNNSGQTTQPSSLEVCSGLNYE